MQGAYLIGVYTYFLSGRLWTRISVLLLRNDLLDGTERLRGFAEKMVFIKSVA